jgi:hypothetical protein
MFVLDSCVVRQPEDTTPLVAAILWLVHERMPRRREPSQADRQAKGMASG